MEYSTFKKYKNTNGRVKNKFYFDDFSDDAIEHKRKYVNDWSEFREFVGFDDIDLVDNELVIVNMTAFSKSIYESKLIYASNYNVLRIMQGMDGLAYA
jgi:hypothetical protein